MGLPTGVSLGMVAAVLIPVAIVTILLTVLVIYTLSGTRDNPGGIGAALLAAGITLLLHAWQRRAGLSILGGTVIYTALVNLVL
ncbi:AzlD domain-containing protein [Corynebacterium sp. P3-F1]|uniref:AzlD domain-containing protein n=1 Tax=Corynebacterium sp. P3-F1 TaxID=3059080 RepID=UPI00265D2A43|nr:AzlD domain-containing protein [Corynebacterium sp. P3-F1]WKK60590.1 AzlD domain-containing protein [Corynebacterium sp. P3-F1]